jgi:hypothetical protein
LGKFFASNSGQTSIRMQHNLSDSLFLVMGAVNYEKNGEKYTTQYL